jgi:uncharacterized membrane protein
LKEVRSPGQLSVARIEAFSDGIFAFAVTLLVLTLTVPDVADSLGGEGLRAALLAEWPRFTIYLISFLMVGQVWMAHHFFFSHFARADVALLWINMLALATIAVLPFSTALLGHYVSHEHDRVVAAFVYGSLWTIGASCLSAMFWYASGPGKLLLPDSSPSQIRAVRRATCVGPLVFGTFTVLTLVSFWLFLAGFAFVPLFYIAQSARFVRR